MQLGTGLDHLAWDMTEAVTLYSMRRGGTYAAIQVPIAKRRAIRSAERSPSGGVYAGHEIRWHLVADTLPPDVDPKLGDLITDASGREWTVLTADSNRYRQVWALGCVDLVLALGLRDTVQIQRAAITYDASGVGTKAFPPDGGRVLYTLPARVQPVAGEIAEERGARYSRDRFDVIVGRQIDVDLAEDRILWTDSTGRSRILDLVSFRQSGQIDQLPILTAEERQ